jgi:DNA replication and repair protein RecF
VDSGPRAALSFPVRVDRFVSLNFRNLGSEPVDFGPGLNLLIGENGQGKTNLLEAIYYFRFGRSFRAQAETDLIRFDEALCRVELACRFGDGHDETFSVAIERRGARTIKIDGQVLPRRSDLAGRFPAVLFGPLELRIVAGEPEHRRRFFDMVGTMTDPAYLRTARDYRRALEQRNAALKARATRDEMAAWNERLVTAGTDLLARRRNLVALIEMGMVAHARDLDSPFDFTMRYESALLDEAGAAVPEDDAALARAFHERLGAVAVEESRRGVTLVGPHRDDVEFRMTGHDLRRYGSQGQRRLFAVLLKMAELTHIETELREPCVLLLDDVFSEFDPSMMARLQGIFGGRRQVFVTSPVDLDAARAPGARVFRVDAGRLRKVVNADGRA